MMRLMSLKTAKTLAVLMAVCFLCIHIVLFFLFSAYNVTPMKYFNIFSICFYIFIVAVVLKEWFQFFVVGVYLEVVVHMTLAVYFTGLESGFQITLIGMTILLFYAEYSGRYLGIGIVRAVPLSILGALAYLACIIICHFHTPQYPLPDQLCFFLQLFWGVIVFAIMTFFLYTFVSLTINSDRRLSDLAGHDQLTSLPNRYLLLQQLDSMKDNNALEGHWIAMIDIDDFKGINDTYGHNCGDDILRGISDILKNSPINMTAGRWGGEEFLLFGEITGSMDECYNALDALRKEVTSRTFSHGEQTLHLSVTIGLAEYQGNETIDQWIDEADQRMYQGKKSGKNQVVRELVPEAPKTVALPE